MSAPYIASWKKSESPIIYDSSVVGLAMDTNMKAPLCVQTLKNTVRHALVSVEPLSTVTGGANTPAGLTGMRSISMAYSKA